MNRKLMAVVGLAGAAALVMTGCSATPETPAEPDGPVTITYTNFISNDGNEANLATIVDAFEAANKNITVKVTTLPYSDYGTALQTDLAAGTVADTFDIEYANYAAYQANGVLAPLKVSNPDAYRQGLLKQYSTGGTSYALPSSFSDVVLYYNKDLFDAAGVSYPTNDWTWSDEKAAALKITDKTTGVWGDHQPVSYNEYYKTVAQNGGQFLNDDQTKVAFNTPAGIEAAHWLVDKSGTVMPTIAEGQGTADFDTNLFKDGKLAMLHTGIWVFSSFVDSPPNWDIAVEPGNTTHASAAFSNAIGVSAASKNIAAATKWVEFMTSSDVMAQVRLDTGWELPAISDKATLATYLDKGAPANRQAVFDALDNIALPPTLATGQSEMQDVMTEELVEAQSGRKTVEQALDSAETRINAILAGG